MRRNKVPVRFTGQHFTVDQVLINDAIKISQINKDDIVLDIGAGKGFLTVHLTHRCQTVIAIEKDRSLCFGLRKQFSVASNVLVRECDFRKYALPERSFKVVSNIPYGITSDILKSLMYSKVEHFQGGCLVMQLEPARKLCSKRIYNPYAVFYHTFFDLKLMYEVAPESFVPPPKVKSALLRIVKKSCPTISTDRKEKYLDFLSFVLQKPDLSIRVVLKKLFRKSQVRVISERYGVHPNSLVVDLSVRQWAGCFKEMLDQVPEKYHPRK